MKYIIGVLCVTYLPAYAFLLNSYRTIRMCRFQVFRIRLTAKVKHADKDE